MVDRLSGIYSPPKPIANQGVQQRPPERVNIPSDGSFAEILETKTSGTVRFSAHAQERLRTRSIQLSERDEAELAQAVEMASAKGAKESLILMDDLALVVSIRNRVVITAMERDSREQNVFTNIDSAVLLHRNQ